MKIFLLLFGLLIIFTANAEDKQPGLVGDIDKILWCLVLH